MYCSTKALHHTYFSLVYWYNLCPSSNLVLKGADNVVLKRKLTGILSTITNAGFNVHSDIHAGSLQPAMAYFNAIVSIYWILITFHVINREQENQNLKKSRSVGLLSNFLGRNRF